MAIRPVPYPKINDLSENLFGGDIFSAKAPTKVESDNLFALPELPKVDVSAGASQAIKNMQQADAQAQQMVAMAQRVNDAQEKAIADLNKQTEQNYDAVMKLRAERAKAEEQARKEAEKAVNSDSTALIKNDLKAFIESSVYQEAGDVQRRDMLNDKMVEIEAKLRQQGLDDSTIAKSVQGFRTAVNLDIDRYLEENTNKGFWRTIGNTIADITNSTGNAVSQFFAGRSLKDARFVQNSQETLLNGGVADGWEVEEMLERDDSLRKYLVKDGIFDSTADWRLRSDLTEAEKAEFNRKATAVFGSIQNDITSDIASSNRFSEAMSKEQQREMKNYAYESAKLKQELDAKGSSGLERSLANGLLLLSYPSTLLTENSGTIVEGVTVALGTALATGVAFGSAGSAVPADVAAVAGWARLANYARHGINALVNGATSAGLTETDIYNTVREEVMNAKLEDLMATKDFQDLLAMSGGNEQLARQRLATKISESDLNIAKWTSFAVGTIGPEALLSNALTKGAFNGTARTALTKGATTAATVGKNVGVTTLSSLSEGVEEGITQRAVNYSLIGMGFHKDPSDGVWEAVGAGVALGGIMNAPTAVVSTMTDLSDTTKKTAQQSVSGTFTTENINAKSQSYAEQGKADFNALRSQMAQDMTSFVYNLNEGYARSPEAITNLKQRYYDTFVDVDSIHATLTPTQFKQLSEMFKTSYEVNTNAYRKARHTASMAEIANPDVMPTDSTLADVWRVHHNKDGQNVTNPRVAVALNDLFNQMLNSATETTKQRAERGQVLLNSIRKNTPNLTEDDITTINRVMYKHFDANYDREVNNGQQTQTSPVQSTGGDGTNPQTATAGADGSVANEATNTEETSGPTTAVDEGVGGSNPPQTPAEANPTSLTPTGSASIVGDDGGAGETPQAQQNTNAPTTVGGVSSSSSPTGVVGPTNQSNQPIGPIVAQGQGSAVSGGVVGTPPPKRNPNGKRSEIATIALNETTPEEQRVINELKDRVLQVAQSAPEIDPDTYYASLSQEYDTLVSLFSGDGVSVADFLEKYFATEIEGKTLNYFQWVQVYHDAAVVASDLALVKEYHDLLDYVESLAKDVGQFMVEPVSNTLSNFDPDLSVSDRISILYDMAEELSKTEAVQPAPTVGPVTPIKQHTLITNPADISEAISNLETAPSKRGKLLHNKQIAKRHKRLADVVAELKASISFSSGDRITQYMRLEGESPRAFSIRYTRGNTTIVGQLVKTNDGENVIIDDITGDVHIVALAEATRDLKNMTFNSINAKANGEFRIEPVVPEYLKIVPYLNDVKTPNTLNREVTTNDTTINPSPSTNDGQNSTENTTTSTDVQTVPSKEKKLRNKRKKSAEEKPTVTKRLSKKSQEVNEDVPTQSNLESEQPARTETKNEKNNRKVSRRDGVQLRTSDDQRGDVRGQSPTKDGEVKSEESEVENLDTLLDNLITALPPQDVADLQDLADLKILGPNTTLKGVLYQLWAFTKGRTNVAEWILSSAERVLIAEQRGVFALTAVEPAYRAWARATKVWNDMLPPNSDLQVVDWSEMEDKAYALTLELRKGNEPPATPATPVNRGTGRAKGRPPNNAKEDFEQKVNDLSDDTVNSAFDSALSELTEPQQKVITDVVKSYEAVSESPIEARKSFIVDLNFGLLSKNGVKPKSNLRQHIPALTIQKARRGISETLESFLQAIRNGILSAVAFVSLTAATWFGTSLVIPTDAQASPVAGMSVQASQTLAHIKATNDNDSKPFIIADKQQGTLSLMSADGQLLNTTPALFGESVGDGLSGKTTPAGRYGTQATTTSSKGYGGTVQALTVNGELATRGDGVFAIHRVLDIENRPARLKSKTATDNRISHGCINVPNSFYDQHIEGKFNGVVYVLPETTDFTGQMFQDGSKPVLPQTNDQSPSGRQQTPTATSATGNQTQVVTTQDITSGGQDPATVTTSPTILPQPAVIEGTTPSEQVAVVEPIITADNKSVTAIVVPEGQVTPAESVADDKFDTEATTAVSEESGFSIASIVVGLTGLLGGGATTKRLTSKRKDKNGSSNSSSSPNSSSGNNTTSKRVDINSISNETELVKALRQALDKAWEEDQSVTQSNLRFLLDTQGDEFSEFINGYAFMQSGIDNVLADDSVAQSQRGFKYHWFWDKDRTKLGNRENKSKGLTGLGQFYARHIAGISPRFDDYMNALRDKDGNFIVPRFGMAQDSSILSTSLGAIHSKTGGIYGYLNAKFIQPITDQYALMNTKYANVTKGKKEGDVGYDVVKDFGDYTNLRHILNEGAKQHFNNYVSQVNTLVDSIENRIDSIVRLIPNGAFLGTDRSVFEQAIKDGDLDLVLSEITSAQDRNKAESIYQDIQTDNRNANRIKKEYELALAIWNGEEDWDVHKKRIPMPGGVTLDQAQEWKAQIEATYEKADLDNLATMQYSAFMGIRQVGVATGAFSNDQIAHFNRIGFKEYVPLYKRKDKKERDTSDDEVDQSYWEELFADYTVQEIKSMGLTRDLSQYKRGGMRSPADDAFTNLTVFARNIAGRSGQAEFGQNLQRLFENSINLPVGDVGMEMSDFMLLQDNIIQRNPAIPGLVRVVADVSKRHIPNNDKIKDMLPITAKGHIVVDTPNGREIKEVAFHYYFEDLAIQNELTHTINVNSVWHNNFLSNNARTIMRWQARMMTSFRLTWNIWNFAREWFERGATLMFRPVVNSKGERVTRLQLATAFNKNLAKLTFDRQAHDQVARYIMYKEVKTPLQRIVRDLHQNGSINLYTDVSLKYELMGEQDLSFLENIAKKVQKQTRSLASKTGTTEAVAQTAEELYANYIARIVETPQTLNAIAMYMAYKDSDVNTREAMHRVRDAFDPLRSQSNVLQSIAAFFPFVRSTGAGHYNTWRDFGDVIRDAKEGNYGGVAIMTAMVLAGATLLAGISTMWEDEDEDEVLAYMPTEELQRGIPIKIGGSVFFFPVGHGLPAMLWAASVALFKTMKGTYTAKDAALDGVAQVAKNTAVSSLPSAKGFNENAGKTIALMFTPQALLPIMEATLNQTLYGGNKTVYQETPRDEKDSEQDTFHTPDSYKTAAKMLNSVSFGLLDPRPENVRHVFNNTFGIGPFRAIEAFLQDKSEKTGGVQSSKIEDFGPLGTALGLDIGINTRVLGAEGQSYILRSAGQDILTKYDVKRTKGSQEPDVTIMPIPDVDMSLVKEGTSVERIANELYQAGAKADEIQYVVNTLLFENSEKNFKKDLRELGRSYYNKIDLKDGGRADRDMVRDKALELLQLQNAYVVDNNNFYKEYVSR